MLGDAGAPDWDTYCPVNDAREDAALLADVLASDAFVFAVEALDAAAVAEFALAVAELALAVAELPLLVFDVAAALALELA